jgi:crossover junction endodeoxyribonuclease RuvC
MRTLGIDPGLHITGYGLLDEQQGNIKLIEAGIIKTNREAEMTVRLLEISKELGAVIAQFSPDALAIEELYSHYEHPKTSIIMGHARGVILLKAAEAGIPVFAYASTRIKNTLTGYGRATKQQMQLMMQSTLGLKAMPEPPDVADALAVALCHCRAASVREMVSV